MAGETAPRLQSRRTVRPDGARYEVNVLTFSVIRESTAPDLRECSSPAMVVETIRAVGAIPDDAREHFVVLFVDTKNRLMAVHEVSVGTLTASLAAPREVFGPALRVMGVAGVVLVHNHPSGDPTPSQEDIRLTRQLAEAGRLLDIRVLDHVVIGNGSGRHVSFLERGLLQ